MFWSSRKYPLDKTEFIALMDAHPNKKSISIPHTFEIIYEGTSFKYLSTLKYYLKVLQACLGVVEITHFMKQNQFIAPMDPYSYEKKASRYLKSLKYYRKARRP